MAGRPGPLCFFAGIVSCSQSVVRRILGAVALDEAGQHGQQAEGSISSEREACAPASAGPPPDASSRLSIFPPGLGGRPAPAFLATRPRGFTLLHPRPPPNFHLGPSLAGANGADQDSVRSPAAKPPTESCTSRGGLRGNNLPRFAEREHAAVHNTFSAAAAFQAVHHRASLSRGSPGPRQGLVLQLEALVLVLAF